MAKSAKIASGRTQSAKMKKSGHYEILGTTKDGVRILKPKDQPTSFTLGEIRKTIRDVMAGRKTG